MIDWLRRNPGPERGGEIALGQRGVVPIPMQMHALARLLVEDRGKVAGGVAFIGRDRVEQHLHLDQLVRIEGINPTWPPRRLRRQERLQARAPLDEAFAHPWYDDVPPHLLLDRTEICSRRLDGRNELVRLQSLVHARVENEPDEPIEIQIVGRHATDDDALGPFGRSVSPGVANRTVEPDEINAVEIPPGNADRQILLPALAVDPKEETEGAVVEAAIELCRKQSRQRLPHPERYAAALVGADRPMLEMPCDVGKCLGAIARQALRGGEREAHRNQTDKQPQREQDQYGKEQQ